MAKEKMEDISTEKLLKRKKFFTFCLGIYIGIVLVLVALIIFETAREGNLDKSSLYGTVPIVASFWIPLLFLREVNRELKRRGVSK